MEILSAKELSKYIKINEKKIYQLARESQIPHMWIGGKVVFAREVIDKWILENTEREKHILIAGSDDILLRRIIDTFNKDRKSLIFYAPIGSVSGLKALNDKAATLSAVHIMDIQKNEYNTFYLERYLGTGNYTVVHLFVREQGLYVEKGNPHGVRSFSDIAKKGLTFLNRFNGSGTRLLLDLLLQRAGVLSESVKGYETEAESHLQAGLRILNGEAQCSFGIRFVAHTLGLDFVPLHQEEFHLVIPDEYVESAAVRRLLDFFDQSSIILYFTDFTGYDISRMGLMLPSKHRK